MEPFLTSFIIGSIVGNIIGSIHDQYQFYKIRQELEQIKKDNKVTIQLEVGAEQPQAQSAPEQDQEQEDQGC